MGVQCSDCGGSTAGEYYRLNDAVWARTGLNVQGAELCVGCAEKRLGRKLTRADFDNIPLNYDPNMPRTPRLISRLSEHVVAGLTSRLSEHVVAVLLENDNVDPKAFIQAHGQQLDGPSRKHLFVSSTDGGLYDTRKPDWHKGPPIRQNYQKFSPRIYNVKDFKATWRARHNSNYPLAFILSDGEAICEQCVADNLRRIIDSTRTQSNDGWRVVGVSACHGDPEEEADCHTQCAQCNKNLGELG